MLAAALAAGGLVVSASAQMRGSPGSGGGGWTPPFTPATPGMLGGLQNLLATPAGLKLTSDIPSFSAVRSFSPNSDTDLRVVGALSAHLPAGFESNLAAALRRSQTDPDAMVALTKTLGDAYQAAVPDVAKSVQSRAQQVVVSVAYDQIDGRELLAASRQLERFGFFGPAVQDKSSIVKRLASQQLMDHAQKIASDFLRFQRSADDGRAQARPESASTYAPAGEKKIPEAWKLNAYKKAAGETGSAVRPAPPSPVEPKAKPMSADLYERIGAKAGMTAVQIESAYRRTAELYRPERYVDRDTKSIIVLTVAFNKVEEAYAVLGDPQKRAEYDRGGPSKKAAPSPNPLSENYYERLGATKDMTPGDIKSAYRRAAASFHPDKSRSKDPALVSAMTKAFQDIGEAYATLSDPQRRAAYDRKLPKDSPRR